MPHKSKETTQDEPGADFEPAESIIIDTPEMLKVVGDPLRLDILGVIYHEAHTVKQIADRLDQPLTRLYYHVAELQEAGFIALVDTRVKSGIIEKYYRIAAKNLSVSPALLNRQGGQEDSIPVLISSIFSATAADMLRSYHAGLVHLEPEAEELPANQLLNVSYYRLRPEKALEFTRKFEELLHEMSEEVRQGSQATELLNYACTIAFFPRVKTESDALSREK